jgi:imidazolonepropionase-like amidohydrolase
VPVLAGTDALDPFVLHGAALHQELVYLTSAGLSPAEVLRAATTAPGMTLGEGGEALTIAAGHRADLVLLSRNPLVDIEATQEIHTVIANGTVYGPDARARMTAFVKDQAGSLAVGARSWWALFGFDPL